MEEIWKTIPEFEKYKASNLGRIMGPRKILKLFGKRYKFVNISYGPAGTTTSVQRLVMAAFVGPRPKSLCVNHIDGNPSNNRLDNLEYVTYSDNTKHAYRLGLMSSKGEKHSQAILNDCNVREIRNSKLTKSELAKKYGVSWKCIKDVISRRRWPHVE